MARKKTKPQNSGEHLPEFIESSMKYDVSPKPSKSKNIAKFAGILGVSSVLTLGMIAPVGFAVSAGINSAQSYWDELDSELLKDEIRLPQKTVLLDKDGKKFAEFYSENRENIPFDKMGKYFSKAIVATEDSRFYETNGFDTIGLARSAVSTISGKEKQGASGINQQLVKNLLILNADSEEDLKAVQNRVISTKVQEMKYAIHLNDKYSKEEILEMYNNTVYFGNRAYGIKAAAKTYFDKAPEKLTLGESAMLAGVVNNPTIFDPFTKPENAKMRRDTVLWRMLQVGDIDQKTYDKAVKEKLKPKRGTTENGCSKSEFAYYCSLVQKELLSNKAYGETQEERDNFFYRGGLTITTAMDRKAMKNVDKTLEKAWGNKNRVASGVAVIEPGTGHISAIGQNREWGNGKGQTEVIYATAERQVGSSFKPFVLGTAYEQGIDAGNTVLNSDSFYKPGGGWNYPKPRGFSNFGYYNYGNVNGYKATRQSLNTWFIRMAQRTGVVEIGDFVNKIGLTIPTTEELAENSNEPKVGKGDLSLALGAWGASPIQMANAYATFASGGIYCSPVSILSAQYTDTKEKVNVSDPECHQAIMPNVANQMNRILQEPFKEGGTLPNYKLSGGRVSAGKTGTSNNLGDAWVVGYTPQYATAVWTGDPRGATYTLRSYTQFGAYRVGNMAGTGGPTSGPIWEPIMNSLHKGLPKKGFASPSNDVASAIKATAVPNVSGMDVNTAVTTLQAYGYKVRISEETDDNAIFDKNVVVAQSPVGGANGTYGQEVILTLSKGSNTSIVISDSKEKK